MKKLLLNSELTEQKKQEIAQLETVIQSLKTQQVSLRNSIDQECEALRDKNLAQIESELLVYKTALDVVKSDLLAVKKQLDMVSASNSEKIKLQEEELSTIQSKKWAIESEISTLELKKTETYESILIFQTKVNELTDKHNELTAGNDQLTYDKLRLESDIEVLVSRKNSLDRDYNDSKDRNDTTIVDLEAKVAKLTTIYNGLSQKIVEEQNINQKVSENLAIRQLVLDEQDRNLRLREQKVSVGEASIVRNSNLINM